MFCQEDVVQVGSALIKLYTKKPGRPEKKTKNSIIRGGGH